MIPDFVTKVRQKILEKKLIDQYEYAEINRVGTGSKLLGCGRCGGFMFLTRNPRRFVFPFSYKDAYSDPLSLSLPLLRKAYRSWIDQPTSEQIQ